jgi:hypothetical protein
LDYLNELLFRDYSDREERYVPLEGTERRSVSLARALKNVRMNTDAVLKAFRLEKHVARCAEERRYADALDACRDLRQRRVRRLAVLGEPGAGKSFSLQRFSVEYAREALADPVSPLPLLVMLGLWTRDAETLEAFIERQLGKLGRHFRSLRDEKRAVLLLDGLNEIPPGQRSAKAAQIMPLAEDERLVSVIVSCREKDFHGDFGLPFDTLVLQPLKPGQIREFLRRVMRVSLDSETEAQQAAEVRFWQIAGGPAVREVWEAWRAAGVDDIDVFWAADDIARENPNVYATTTDEQNALWRQTRFDARGLIRLAANPYLLTVMTELPHISNNRAQLFEGILQVL